MTSMSKAKPQMIPLATVNLLTRLPFCPQLVAMAVVEHLLPYPSPNV